MRRPTLLLLALITGCGGSREAELGAFTLAQEGSTITVSHGSGLSLPITGLRTRDAAASYETQYGAFRITERATGPTRTSVELGGFDESDGVTTAELLGDDGEAMGTLSFREVQGSLQITADGSGSSRTALVVGCDPASDGDYLGLGAQTHDVDHRGQIVPLWVSEQGIGKADTDETSPLWPLVGTRHSSYLPVPSIVAPRAAASYGLRSTTDEHQIWDLCATDPASLVIEAWSPTLVVEIAPGPSPLDVMAQQTTRSGRPPLGPDWTFGVWMEAIGGRQAVLDEADLLADAGVPASALWTEDWRGGNREGRSYVLEEDWRADDVLYPDLDGMIAELHRRGLRFMTYFNTFVVEDADVFEEAVQGGHLVMRPDGTPYFFDGVTFKKTGLADLFEPSARAWVRRELEAALARGIDGWMADFAEWYPAERREVVPPEGLTPTAAHQLYAVEWARTNREAVANSGRTDTVIFHRSGWTGSQGVAHVVWAGDQRTTFDTDDGLPTVIPILTGLSMTGFPVVTHDIGGYTSATNPPATRELFFRWTTLGAAGPVMRTHHGRDVDFNWRWSRDEGTKAHFRRWAEWHVRHVPLWKGLARDATELGAPILRPMAWADPGDGRLAAIEDQYLIGDQYLVAPVVTASTTRRTVIVPAGLWYRDRAAIDGPTEVEVEVPLEELALFVRAGALIPQTDGVLPTLSRPEDLARLRTRRVLEVWLGANGRARDGEGGLWTLESPGRPTAITSIEGGIERVRTATVVEVEASGDVELTVRDDAGGAHRLRATGHAADLVTRYRFLW